MAKDRFIRTLKEQVLWLQPFDTVEELRLALLAFKETLQSRMADRAARASHPSRAARRLHRQLYDGAGRGGGMIAIHSVSNKSRAVH